MLGAYLPIAHRVFSSREIGRSTKLQLAHALLDGIHFHGAVTWPELSEGRLGWNGYAAGSCARSVNISVVLMWMVGRIGKSDWNVMCQGWKWCLLKAGYY